MSRPLSLLSFLLVLFGCGAESSGVDTAMHDTWVVEDDPRVRIGVTEGDAPYLFQRIAAARLLGDGRIVVADRGHGALRVFSADGSFLMEMGRSGQGPGEFEYISSLTVTDPDTLNVYDSGAFRLTRYLVDGPLVATQPLLGEGGNPEAFLGRGRGSVGASRGVSQFALPASCNRLARSFGKCV